ncbi:CheY-like superfamily [Xylariaceae sp. FL1651]|nr:CheY-like superfamily [Xylariaceae sp. FL1651]
MPLLRNGTVIRRFPSLCDREPQYDESQPPPGEATPTREVAPIEEVTQVVEGLSTTITFTFRAVEGEVLQSSAQSNSGFAILCADDNMVNQRLLSRLLSKFDQDHVMTENGRDAFEAYKANPGRFPCIFMDLAMPIMDGLEATRRIRAFEVSQPALRRALIVGLLHWNAAQHNLSSLSAVGFDFWMCKPLSLRVLYELFLGGPETNIVMLYGSLREEEKKSYPRLVAEDAKLREDPRSNAIRKELKRRVETNWVVDGRNNVTTFSTKIVIKVAEGDKNDE